jgi:hypothetical protein
MRRSPLLYVAGLLAAAVATALPAGTAVAAPRATAAKAVAAQPALSLHALRVRTTTRHHAEFRLGADHYGIYVEMTHITKTFVEDHQWSFDIPRRLTLGKRGTGRLAVSSTDMEGFGRASLTFRQTTAYKADDCVYGSAKSAHVRAVGTLVFNTHGHGPHQWGSIGTAKHPLRIHLRGLLTLDKNCLPPGVLSGGPGSPCTTGVLWERAALLGEAIKFGRTHFSEIDYFNIRNVGPSQDIERDDFVGALVPKPTFTQNEAGATLVVRGNGHRVTGTAILTAPGNGTSQLEKCTTAGSKQQYTEWDGASYRNGRKPLTLHPDLGGPQSAKDSAHGATLAVLTVAKS